MKKAILILQIFFCLSSIACAGHNQNSDEASPSFEKIFRRTVVPNAENPQGEVQLIKRGEQLIARTLLASRVLRRVAAMIDQKERRNWPETRNGNLASVRYREELFRAAEKAWETFRKRSDQNEVRQFLAIEFILDADKGMIQFSLPTLAGNYGQMEIINQKIIKKWQASDDYIRGNIIEIVQDSFQLDEGAAKNLLTPFWPKQ